MSLKIIVSAIVIIFGFSTLPATGAEKNKGEIREDLLRACHASQDVCNAACKRDEQTFSGSLSEILCKDDCTKSAIRCVKSVAMRTKTKGTTGVPEGGKGTLRE